MKILVVIALFACATAFRLPPAYRQIQRPVAWHREPRLENNEDKIVGGKYAYEGQFPYIVSMYSGGRHFCGGSIISSTRVLTAAHCTSGQSASSIKAYAGLYKHSEIKSYEQGRSIGSIKQHSQYNSGTYDCDVSVMTVSAFTWTTYVKSATLDSYEPGSGTSVTVSGWGTTSSGGSTPDILKTVDVHIVGRSACDSDYSGAITSNMVCAADPGEDSCQGDSGGPLVRTGTYKLVGVVSWGYGCASPSYPGVYANVARLNSWIKSQ